MLYQALSHTLKLAPHESPSSQPLTKNPQQLCYFLCQTLTKYPQQVWQTLNNFDYPYFVFPHFIAPIKEQRLMNTISRCLFYLLNSSLISLRIWSPPCFFQFSTKVSNSLISAFPITIFANVSSSIFFRFAHLVSMVSV